MNDLYLTDTDDKEQKKAFLKMKEDVGISKKLRNKIGMVP